MGKIEELFSTFLEDSISDHTFCRTYEICEELGFSHFLTKMQIEEDIIYIIDILKRILEFSNQSVLKLEEVLKYRQTLRK